jgi:membrane protein YdbS with pleckstrin-like domain
MMHRDVPDGPDGLDGLDAETSRRILRTFLVVRIVRGSLLLLFLVVAMVGVEARGWPTGVTAVIALAMVVQVGALVHWCARYARSREGSRRGAGTSPSA